MDTFSAVDSVPTSNFDQNLKDLISDYNEFVDKNGYTDRKITSYDSYNNSKSKAESDNREYQREIAKYEKKRKQLKNERKNLLKVTLIGEEVKEMKSINTHQEKLTIIKVINRFRKEERI